jgi:hypothetical protein
MATAVKSATHLERNLRNMKPPKEKSSKDGMDKKR